MSRYIRFQFIQFHPLSSNFKGSNACKFDRPESRSRGRCVNTYSPSSPLCANVPERIFGT